jgi:hypothetical protein
MNTDFFASMAPGFAGPTAPSKIMKIVAISDLSFLCHHLDITSSSTSNRDSPNILADSPAKIATDAPANANHSRQNFWKVV